MKKTIASLLGGAAAGFLVAFFLFSQAQYSGCSFDVKLSWPPSFQFDCAGAPHQVLVNFGSRPSQMPLGKALRIIADMTQSRGAARVWVDQSVLNLPIATTLVDPPAGAKPSLGIVQELLAQGHANDVLAVCLVPQGGYEVRILK